MFSPPVAHFLLGLIVVVGILLMLIRPRNIPEVYWMGGGVFLLLVLRLVPWSLAGRAAAKGTDVYFFLTGMMLLSELAREHGVFDWVSSVAVRRAKGSYSRLFLLVYAVGTLVTIFMSNDATAVVLTPAILAAVRKAEVEPLPYLFACAFIANAASFVLPISNPANLVVFHNQMPALGRWLLWFGVPSLLSVGTTFAVLRWIFRKQLRGRIERQVEDHSLKHHGKLVLCGLGATAIVLLAASYLNWDLGLPTLITALAVTGIVSLKARNSPFGLLHEISWSALALVAGLFVMVDAVETVGAMRLMQAWLAWAEKLAPSAGALITGFAVGIANNLVNNLPLGLVAGATLQAAHAKGLMASAVLIGVDLGPNLSITGSLATILWLIALRKEKLDVSFWDFLKVGAIAMPIALLVSIGGAIVFDRQGDTHERQLDHSVHHTGRRFADLRCRDERPAQQVDCESVARFGSVVRGDYVFLHGTFFYDATSIADVAEPGRHALVGCHRGVGRSRAGVRGTDPRQQSRGGSLCRVDGDGGPPDVSRGRSFWLVPNGTSSLEPVEDRRRGAARGRGDADCEILTRATYHA